MSKQMTMKLVEQLKDTGTDYEYYPSTPAMITCIKNDIRSVLCIREGEDIKASVLDVGAGKGDVLTELTTGSKYAIELAQPLLDAMDKNIFIVGTDMRNQALIDKRVDIVFSNPAYSDMSNWCEKVIKEANASLIYLIIPTRWKADKKIQLALEAREAKATIIGEFDFGGDDAYRQTRHGAAVDVIRIDLVNGFFSRFANANYRFSVDPFELWFKENFNINESMKNGGVESNEEKEKRNDKRNEIIKSEGLVKALENFYNRDMTKLVDNYSSLGDLDPTLLIELGVKIEDVQEGLKLKISGLKNHYWKELFHNLSAITNRLTKKSREKLLNTLLANTSVDFTAENAHSIVLWCIKNANNMFDEQLIEIVERMSERANIELYKSNKRCFGDELWRFNNRAWSYETVSHYKLDYRIVLTNMGGLSSSYDNVNGLSKHSISFIDDLRTVASNLGMDSSTFDGAEQVNWGQGIKNTFGYKDLRNGKVGSLFDAKGFKNGNIHLRLNSNLLIKLNTEFGRLKGWVKNAQNASEEMNVNIEDVSECFNSNVQLISSNIPLLINAA